MCLNVSISLMLILILIFLISTLEKISFKFFLLINDMMYFGFIYIMIFSVNKIKNIIKITKYHCLKASLIFDVFFDIYSMITQSKLTKYVIFSIFFCSFMSSSFSLIKIIIKLIITMINVF